MPRRSLMGALILAAAGCLACDRAGPPIRTYALRVTAQTGQHERLPGVRLWLDGEPLGTTADEGLWEGAWRGFDGQRVSVRVECPQGFFDPRHRKQLTLMKVVSVAAKDAAPGLGHLPLDVTCFAEERTVVIAVRAEQPDLPIRLHDQVLGHTNSLGVAHVEVTVPRYGDFQLTLDTTRQPALRPQSPSKLFEVDDADSFLLWDQPTSALPSKPRARRRVSRQAPAYPLR